jgi:hypothetical protein
MVMVAVLDEVEVLAATVTVTVPLLEPLVGETTAHAESEAAVQEVLEVTAMDATPAEAATFWAGLMVVTGWAPA